MWRSIWVNTEPSGLISIVEWGYPFFIYGNNEPPQAPKTVHIHNQVKHKFEEFERCLNLFRRPQKRDHPIKSQHSHQFQST